jgi:hypothetical protein
MRVALLYFGKSRSIRQVYETQNIHVKNVLKDAGITYDTYMHTWDTSNNAVLFYETGIPEDTDSYALLEPTYFRKDNQNEFLASIDLHQYLNNKNITAADLRTYSSEWLFKPQLIQNHICALESQRRVFQMAEETGIHYDAYIVIRPDAFFTSDIDIKPLQSIEEGVVYLPDWDHWLGYNDRFAFGSKEVIRIYTHRLRDLAEFRQTRGPITSEKCMKLTIEKYNLRASMLSVRFDIYRPKPIAH